jgi:hypothetical protein
LLHTAGKDSGFRRHDEPGANQRQTVLKKAISYRAPNSKPMPPTRPGGSSQKKSCVYAKQVLKSIYLEPDIYRAFCGTFFCGTNHFLLIRSAEQR